MKIYLTFDVEIWCDGWSDLDGRFASSFARYVYGRSARGDYALPRTMEILSRHGLRGVFFVEPLFAARFGITHLRTIVDLIRAGGHDVQLHLHPEWTDEIRPLPFEGAHRKRQHLNHYTLAEQIALLRMGRELLAQAGGGQATAFRAGSFACNHDTYRALREVGIGVDSSLHAVLPDSGVDLRQQLDFLHPLDFESTRILPMGIFRDGFGRLRPAQVGACSFGELRDAILSAAGNGVEHFVLLSHNFEMLKQGRSEPDPIVVSRFERLCAFLETQRDHVSVGTFDEAVPAFRSGGTAPALPQASVPATLGRYAEQAVRRLIG